MPRKTQPHLCFEITSEDGFNVQADSIDGEGAAGGGGVPGLSAASRSAVVVPSERFSVCDWLKASPPHPMGTHSNHAAPVSRERLLEARATVLKSS